MGRIMAIDYGKKRVGIAVSDPQQIIANGLLTVETPNIFAFIDNYIKQEFVDCIVVGKPKQMNNTDSESEILIKPFVEKLTKKYPDIEIHRFDERFTSKMAFQTMIDAGLKKHDRQNKALIDTISATIILQSFMEFKKNKL